MSEYPHKFSFIWHTTWLEPCGKCRSLNGRVYHTQSIYDAVLWDEIYGDIWDLVSDVSLVHPNCKCVLEVTYESNLEELLKIEPDGFEEFQIMTSNIKEMRSDLDAFDRDLQRVENRVENSRQQLMTFLMLLQKLGLPPEAERAIRVLVKTRMTAEQTVRALYMLQAFALAPTPIGLVMALATGAVAVLGASSIAADLGGQ